MLHLVLTNKLQVLSSGGFTSVSNHLTYQIIEETAKCQATLIYDRMLPRSSLVPFYRCVAVYDTDLRWPLTELRRYRATALNDRRWTIAFSCICQLNLCIADGGVDDNGSNNGRSTASSPSGPTAAQLKAAAHRHLEASTRLAARWSLSVQVSLKNFVASVHSVLKCFRNWNRSRRVRYVSSILFILGLT
jgi:hypothetical protein